MSIFEEKVVPFEGLGDIKLLSTLDDVKNYLSKNKIQYKIEFRSNKGCDPEVPWILLRVDDSIIFKFAKNKLWQIFLEEKFSGSLPNGIKIGMKMDDALKIDPSLRFDDWNEDFESENGYWLEDDLDNNTVLSITIFIKEAMDEETFFRYEW